MRSGYKRILKDIPWEMSQLSQERIVVGTSNLLEGEKVKGQGHKVT